MHPDTLAVHSGRGVDSSTAAVTLPIHLSTTFERTREATYPLGFEYAREQNPTRQALEHCLAELEGGKHALCFASGMAVCNAVLQSLEPGDHVILADDTYWGLRKLATLHRHLQFDLVDLTNPAAVEVALRKETRLIWAESPSNPLMKVTDLAAIAKIARARNVMTVCDSTFATPIFQRPLDHAIDLVMHSTTKYIGGHSDLTGGALITRHDNYLFERCRQLQTYGGAVPSPFDCWLALRGLSTLPVRMRAIQENATRIVEFLKAHPQVEKVNYAGFSGMLSFLVKGGKPEALAAAGRMEIFTRATSLGGTHSLIEHRASVEGPTTKTPQNLLRMSVGLEHIDDLLADLRKALG
jgi:cystathionine gamma-synthase